jgi:hypothetical protein
MSITPEFEALARGMNAIGEDLTGAEEDAIAEAFGKFWWDESLDMMPTFRALVFALKTREGMDHAAAKSAVAGMKAKDVKAVVLAHDPGEDEIPGVPPVTEAGKDATPDAE